MFGPCFRELALNQLIALSADKRILPIIFSGSKPFELLSLYVIDFDETGNEPRRKANNKEMTQLKLICLFSKFLITPLEVEEMKEEVQNISGVENIEQQPEEDENEKLHLNNRCDIYS